MTSRNIRQAQLKSSGESGSSRSLATARSGDSERGAFTEPEYLSLEWLNAPIEPGSKIVRGIDFEEWMNGDL